MKLAGDKLCPRFASCELCRLVADTLRAASQAVCCMMVAAPTVTSSAMQRGCSAASGRRWVQQLAGRQQRAGRLCCTAVALATRHAGACCIVLQLQSGRSTECAVWCCSQVAGQAAPATLKAAFLDPVADSMSTEVAMQLFAKTDAEFMQMFTGMKVAMHSLGRAAC